ncbi:MAG: hypothetical protein GYB50_20470 [Rhodobacteraceae bacterium]|nr:hypothetical protein [Paracoccaceae bacterium]
MTNTTTNRMKRLIADISEHGATPSRVKKITNALRAVTAERDRLREALELAIGLGLELGMTDIEEAAIRDRAGPCHECGGLVYIGDSYCPMCSPEGRASLSASSAKKESSDAA